ncbi:DUF6415 family natural product biosynthesis protein [Streptomyces sp. NPDC059629]|uniref:DUF6415 family natural product biosynthesis protein n=1 Tax=Streptomyces sp. NPDC059629 TaxID=3346889 RepID=UPI00367D9A5A
MPHRTAQSAATADLDQVPPDIATMRRTAQRFLAPDAQPIANDDLTTLGSALRGQIEELIPTIEAMTRQFPADDVPSACALVCTREARMRLGLRPGYNSPGRMTVAMKLARSVMALCDHYQTLGGHQ